jgi:hypothetical protein
VALSGGSPLALPAAKSAASPDLNAPVGQVDFRKEEPGDLPAGRDGAPNSQFLNSRQLSDRSRCEAPTAIDRLGRQLTRSGQ